MSTLNMLRGQIWLYNSNPSVGDEISKIRPAIIVNNDAVGVLRLKIVVPITGWNNAFVDVPWLVMIEPDVDNGLSKTSVADTFQVRSISQQRLIKPIGSLSVATMAEISQALATVLSIGG
jgi:mRNA interferase MazF